MNRLLAGRIACGVCALTILSLAGLSQSMMQRQTYQVPMRDGTKLATDVYLPPGDGPFPVILARTPYNKDAVAAFGLEAVRRGYAMVIQDMRGRFASQGENLPFESDGWWNGKQDGLDTVRWIRAQSWAGPIGTFGGSALGIAQLFLAGTGTRDIKAQSIQVASGSMYHDIVYSGGVYREALADDWTKGSRFAPDAAARWRAHPTYDAMWRERDLQHRWALVNAPAVHVGGWYDIFAQGTINAFLGYQNKGGPGARGRQKLVMGPWTHGILQSKAGDFTFPGADKTPSPVTDPWAIFDHYLKGVDNGWDRLPAVTYYTMGDTSDPNAPGNRWRTADSWPPPATITPWKLTASGTLQTADAPAGKRTWRADPNNPVPSAGGPQLTIPAGPRDQRAVENRRDVLVFRSAVLHRPLEVIGRVRARLWVSSTAPDLDLAVKLCDVYPDGRSYNICEGIQRVSLRNRLDRRELLRPGQRVLVDIDLWSTSMVFNKGHRIGVQVAASNSRAWAVNPQNGQVYLSGRGAVAEHTLHMGGPQASAILLPVVKGNLP